MGACNCKEENHVNKAILGNITAKRSYIIYTQTTTLVYIARKEIPDNLFFPIHLEL